MSVIQGPRKEFLGPILLQRSDDTTRIAANGGTAFYENRAPIG